MVFLTGFVRAIYIDDVVEMDPYIYVHAYFDSNVKHVGKVYIMMF